ncbi:SatD family protein [Aeromicrobium sp. CTD01-1L150]|uniref:SatD family protein n=1 Tax=Aeromicrobium sp. CTD01-1L150 TaxID=3341830 RepID=UPI0035C088D7
MKFAVIGDLVGSRSHDSRRHVQESLVSALATAGELVESLQELEPTIGDEFQSVHADLHDALLATVLVRLALPEHLDARCGIGVGPIEIVGASAYGLTQDGPAWWAAREAIDEVKGAQRTMPYLRTRIRRPDHADGDLAQAYLECRDHIVSTFDGRQRRIALGVISGRTAAQIADDEGISASAVSQRTRSSGIRALTESVKHVPAGVPDWGHLPAGSAVGCMGDGRQEAER